MKKMFIVVKITEHGSGNISGNFDEATAITYYENYLANMNESKTKGFVKIFDVDGNEYSAEQTLQFGKYDSYIYRLVKKD